MTRTGAYKGIYFTLVLAGALAIVLMAAQLRSPLPALAALALLLLAPGRILGFFWRDLLAGLRLLNCRDYEQSIYYSQRFLSTVRERPWLKNLVWLGASSYSRDPEVLALNNLGAAEIGLGRFDKARSYLDEAIAMDPKCPLPYFNMGALCLQTGPRTTAQPWFDQAIALGFTGGPSDRIVMASQARFAVTDGRVGAAPAAPTQPSTPAAAALGPGDVVVELLNDDKTPMEFVVNILEDVFGKTFAEARRIMLETHKRGRGTCGAYARDEAEAKVAAVVERARKLGFPLVCQIVPNPSV